MSISQKSSPALQRPPVVVTPNNSNHFFVLMPPPFDHGFRQGAQNHYERLTAHELRNPHLAMQEWLLAARTMTELGATVCVLPFDRNSRFGLSSDIVYMANSGYLFQDKDRPLFVGARMLHSPRGGEHDYLSLLFSGEL